MMKRSVVLLSVLLILITAIPAAAGGRQSASGMSGSKEIEVFMSPWNTVPIEGTDPIKEYLDKVTGYNWKLTRSSAFESELTTMAAASRMPDLIVIDDSRLLFNLYDQGVFIDDWSPYKTSMPNTFKNMGDLGLRYYERNGKLTCVTTRGGDQYWAWLIRKDWLDKLGLKMPATIDELLAVGKAFTFNDPDGNGRNDTYGFTSAGNNGIGEIYNIQIMFGPTTWYVENNKVSHPIVDGSYKNTLDFIKAAVDQGTIDPDWYTIGWEARKPNLFQGKYGIVYYPPEALLAETDFARQDKAVIDWYAVIPNIKASPGGGKNPPIPPFGQIRTVSSSAAGDKAKLEAIIKILESCAYPNLEEYRKIRSGYAIDGEWPPIKDLGNGYKYIWSGGLSNPHRVGEREGQNYGLLNWGRMVSDYAEWYVLMGDDPEPNALNMKVLELSAEVNKYDRYPADLFMLNLNSDNQVQANTLQSEFAIQYILGQTSDYNGFVKRWLASGGQALLDEAAQQFKGYGIIK
jgi:putative aldouronate transport system substrate-binding protein